MKFGDGLAVVRYVIILKFNVVVDPLSGGVDAVMATSAVGDHIATTTAPMPADTHSQGACQRHGDGHGGSDDDDRSQGRHQDDQALSRVDDA